VTGELGFWARFLIAALARWRITHLLAKEDGPADLIVRARTRLEGGFLSKLMDCFYCLSFWVAAPLALFVASGLLDGVLVWLALSGAACLLEGKEYAEPVVIERLDEDWRER
jgi:hypothetical protein